MASFVVFAKEPVAGRVKTRLSPPVPPEDAAALYDAFVGDVCEAIARVAGAGDRRVLAAPEPGPRLAAIAKEHGFVVAEQVGPDLGARMRHALATEIARGADAVVLVGSDSPTLPAGALAEARARLAAAPGSVVIGPAADGGYWLIGCAQRVPDLFDGVPWSTRDVLSTTLHRARRGGVPVTLLPFWYDVDEIGDLVLLDAHLTLLGADIAPRTRSALARFKAERAGFFPS